MLISKFQRVDKEKIEEFEQRYAIDLPNQYKCFLLKYNGGFTPETRFNANSEASDIKGFYGIGDVELKLEDKVEKYCIDNIIPIACDSFGNSIVIGLTDGNYGKIFFCDHEKNNQLVYLAEDLVGFIKKCKSEKISDNVKMTIEEREELLRKKGKEKNITDGLRKLWQEEIDRYSHIIQEKVDI